MAGHARRNAALTELEVRASAAGLECIEYIEQQLANGVTFLALAEAFTKRTGIEITRDIINRIANGLSEDAPQRIVKAREEGMHALVEKQQAALDLLSLDKDDIARENLRTRNTQWRASKGNKKDFGDSPLVNINQSLGAVHLDVLRRLSAHDARVLQASTPKQIEEPTADYEIVPDGDELL